MVISKYQMTETFRYMGFLVYSSYVFEMVKVKVNFETCLARYHVQQFIVHYVRIYVRLPQRCIMHTNYYT